MDARGRDPKSDSTMHAHAEPMNCFATPRCRLCHRSVAKNEIASSWQRSSPARICGVSSHGKSLPIVPTQQASIRTSSNGMAGRPSSASISCPALHRWQTPKQAFLLCGARGTCENERFRPPIFTRAGKSPLVAKWARVTWCLPSEDLTPCSKSICASWANSVMKMSKACGWAW